MIAVGLEARKDKHEGGDEGRDLAEIEVIRLTVIRHGYDSIPPLGPNP